MRELHWRKLRETLVYKIDAQWSHWSMKKQWKRPHRGNCMPGDQRNRRFPSYVELKVTWKSRSGTLGDSRFGSEKTNGAARLHVVGSEKCVWEMPIWEHYKYWHDGGFCIVYPPMRELHRRKLSKTLVYETDAQWSHWAIQTRWRDPLEVMEF